MVLLGDKYISECTLLGATHETQILQLLVVKTVFLCSQMIILSAFYKKELLNYETNSIAKTGFTS